MKKFGGSMWEAEWTTLKRRLMPKNWRANSAAGYAVVACIYMVMFYSVVQAAGSIEPQYLFFPMMFFTMLVLPIVLHGSIAGERQSRSLEALYAAPVTPAQIVLAKAGRAIPPLIGILMGCGGLMALVGIVRAFVPPTWSPETRGGFLVYLVGILGVLAAGWMVTGMTMWISSVSKSTGAALLGTVGIMIGIFLILPIVVFTVLGLLDPFMTENIVGFHPLGFVGVLLFNDTQQPGVAQLRDLMAGIGVLAWVATGWIFWFLAVGRMRRERQAGVAES